LQLDERRSEVIKTEEPRADRKLPGQPSRRWMMHQSLHTLLEVGTGVSFGSGATASTVDPLCHPPNFVTDSVYSPGVYPSSMCYAQQTGVHGMVGTWK